MLNSLLIPLLAGFVSAAGPQLRLEGPAEHTQQLSAHLEEQGVEIVPHIDTYPLIILSKNTGNYRATLVDAWGRRDQVQGSSLRFLAVLLKSRLQVLSPPELVIASPRPRPFQPSTKPTVSQVHAGSEAPEKILSDSALEFAVLPFLQMDGSTTFWAGFEARAGYMPSSAWALGFAGSFELSEAYQSSSIASSAQHIGGSVRAYAAYLKHLGAFELRGELSAGLHYLKTRRSSEVISCFNPSCTPEPLVTDNFQQDRFSPTSQLDVALNYRLSSQIDVGLFTAFQWSPEFSEDDLNTPDSVIGLPGDLGDFLALPGISPWRLKLGINLRWGR